MVDVRELISFLNHIKCWIPHSNGELRAKIDNMINRLKQG